MNTEQLKRYHAPPEGAALPSAPKLVSSDPAPTAEEQIGKRADELIDRITDHALGELRALRDALDEQMRALLAKRDGLKAQVCEQVSLAAQAIEIKTIAQDAVTKLTRSIESGLAERAKVITHKGNGRGT